MTFYDDSDNTTGLPDLETVDPADSLLLTSWSASEGIVVIPGGDPNGVAVHYLHVRGIANNTADGTPEWAQAFLAVPAHVAADVAAALAKGTTEQLG